MYSIIPYVDVLEMPPNLDDIQVLVIPHFIQVWDVLGQQLGIHEAILSTIKNEARRNRTTQYNMAVQMFEQWLYAEEGTGNKDRSWFTILKALVKIGQCDVFVKVVEHFNSIETRNEIGQGEDVCIWMMCSVCGVYTYHISFCTYDQTEVCCVGR